MKATSTLLTLVLAALVVARPLRIRQTVDVVEALPAVVSCGVKQTATQVAPPTIAGAAYWITNEPSGNFVITSNLYSDGTMDFAGAVNAGGRGLHGLTQPVVTSDGLFSQGAIKVSPSGNMLATINPGSNTVTVFAINPQAPSNITMIGTPISSEGEFPNSVAFSPNSQNVCVLNSGAVNGVSCYTVDPKLGLTPMADTVRLLGLQATTPPNGPTSTPGHIIFSEDGTKLMVSVKGAPPTSIGYIATWDVLANGSLSNSFSKSVVPTPGGVPFSLTLIPNTNAVLATDAATGFDVFDFSKADVATASVIPIQDQGATCWSSFSPATGNFYLTDLLQNTVTEVNVSNNLTGSIVKQYQMPANSSTIDNDIVSIGGTDFMYVLAPGLTSVHVMQLNAPGQVTFKQSFDMADACLQSGVTISTTNLQGMTAYIMA